MSYEAILFDFDGVLVDSEPVHFAVWREVLEPFGIELHREYYDRNCIGISDRAMIQRLVDLKPGASFDAIYAEYPRKKRLFRERMLVAPPVEPDTLTLIREVSERYRLAVVTSSGETEVAPILDRIGIANCFHACVYGGDVARLKPAPDPYLRAGELLGVSRALVVEDSEAGQASGAAAGFDVVAIPAAADVARLVRAKITNSFTGA